MNANHSEHSPLVASAGASVMKNASVIEACVLEGIYKAQCLRVKPGNEAAFIPLWDRRNDLEVLLHDTLLRNWFVRQVRYKVGGIAKEISDLTQAMRPLQFVAWEAEAPNTVCTAGKNLALDTFLAGSSYTVVGPYLGLISSTTYSATAAADTMASHAGWLEAGTANTPTYTAPRKTAAWSAASAGAKALSSALSFAITGTGTVKGCFLVYGTGALTTVDNTAGTLMSAGVFSGGDKVVANTDTLNVSYSLAF